jgi:hypothetical protein
MTWRNYTIPFSLIWLTASHQQEQLNAGLDRLIHGSTPNAAVLSGSLEGWNALLLLPLDITTLSPPPLLRTLGSLNVESIATL